MELLREADAVAVRRKSASGEEVARLRQREITVRLMAELLSADKPDEGVASAAAQSRADHELPAAQRLEIAWLQEMLARKALKFDSREAWLTARESGARRLLEEFPDAAVAYEELASLALAYSGNQSMALARELQDAAAPASVKQRSAEILQRQAIEGKQLADVLDGVAGAAAVLNQAAGRHLVFYTWAPNHLSSVERALELAATLPADAVAIGINLGPDVALALEIARDRKLPGTQLYGARAHDSPIVRRLALTLPALVYEVSPEGIVRNISDRTGAKISVRSNENGGL